MAAPEMSAAGCGHASCCCAGRIRALDAQAEAVYEIWRAAALGGLPAVVRTHRPWAQVPPEDRGFFLGLLAAGDDAFWRAWAA